jgi:CRP/FNR family transcriptional regulator
MARQEDRAARAAALLAQHPLLREVGRAPHDTKAAGDLERGRCAAALVEAGVIERFAADAYLSREGDPALHYWFLLSGSVRVSYASPEGFEVVVKVFHAPAAWAEMEVLTDQPHIEDCRAVDPALTLRVPRAPFEEIMERWPRFMKAVLLDTCARFFIAAQNERALAFLPVEKRLANLLLVYVRLYGVAVEGGVALRIKATQADLAAGLGAAKKSVTRALADWKAQGIVDQRGATIVITDLAALARKSAEDLIGVDWIAGSKLDDGRGTKKRV